MRRCAADQRALDTARKVLGLVVSVGMTVVGRLLGHGQRAQRNQAGGKIDQRLQCIRPEAYRSGQEISTEFESDRYERRPDRQVRHSAHGAHNPSSLDEAMAPIIRYAALTGVEADQLFVLLRKDDSPHVAAKLGTLSAAAAKVDCSGHVHRLDVDELANAIR
jgi:hypothetical protein